MIQSVPQRKVVFVVNPNSANGSTGRRWRSLSTRIRATIGDFGELFTAGSGDAIGLTRHALEGGAELVVAVGGDGTINEVVNGFFDEEGAPIRPEAAMGIFPRGTGSDFLRTLAHASSSPEAVAARLGALRRRPIDVGRIEYESMDGERRHRYFVNVASFGTAGLVDQYVNRSTKILGGKASFMIGSVRGLLAYRERLCRIRFDEGEWEEQAITNVAVANGRYFGGGMMVAPGAKIDDGLFDVTIWSGFGLKDFVLHGRRLYDGSHLKLKGASARQARKVEATCEEECLLDVDGEALGRLPITITILPGALALIA